MRKLLANFVVVEYLTLPVVGAESVGVLLLLYPESTSSDEEFRRLPPVKLPSTEARRISSSLTTR